MTGLILTHLHSPRLCIRHLLENVTDIIDGNKKHQEKEQSETGGIDDIENSRRDSSASDRFNQNKK